MRVLWFEVTVPGRYNFDKVPVGSWQDALQEIVMRCPEIELGIAFENVGKGENIECDGVKYFPINTSYNFWERQRKKADWGIIEEKTINNALAIIDEFKPDIIHVFGTEWSFGLVAEHTSIPVVIHMQGSIAPINNALMPPMYSVLDLVIGMGLKPKLQLNAWLSRKKDKSRKRMEARVYKAVKYYMGRTEWDKNLVNLFHPGCGYYYCNEALRKEFYNSTKQWKPNHNKKFRIVTIGISFWKGIDTILRTAHLLKECGFEFEWILVGEMAEGYKRIVENRERMKYDDNNIAFAGYLDAQHLCNLLLSADLYVHTSYIDNSPNAVCEAQYLGMPIIATYVGGIPSLIESGKEGILIAANDPFTLAGHIMRLSTDKQKCIELGTASMKRARKRHNEENILKDLLLCYRSVISDSKNI